MNWLAFLDRIDATRRGVDLETLRHLQRQAMLRLPFENLDIHLGRPICLEHQALFDKIVAGDRGGFCYELNECFFQCLMALGFDADRLEARVELGGPGAPFDHQVTLVRLGGECWLTDIGFGDSCLAPLNLGEKAEQKDGRSTYRIEAARGFHILHELHGEQWSKVLIVNPEPQEWSDFSDRCFFQQTSTDSAFVRKRVCSRATPEGRISLSGNSLKISGSTDSESPVDEKAYTTVLAKHFGISLESPTWRRPLA